MAARYPFYELTSRRHEDDGTCRRCFQAVDMPGLVLFFWERADATLAQAQLLLGDERYVEWQPHAVVSGDTLDSPAQSRGPRAAATCAVDGIPDRDRDEPRGRFKGARTLEPRPDPQSLARARELLTGSDLPAALVHALLTRLPAAPSMPSTPSMPSIPSTPDTIKAFAVAETPAPSGVLTSGVLTGGVVSSTARPAPDSR